MRSEARKKETTWVNWLTLWHHLFFGRRWRIGIGFAPFCLELGEGGENEINLWFNGLLAYSTTPSILSHHAIDKLRQTMRQQRINLGKYKNRVHACYKQNLGDLSQPWTTHFLLIHFFYSLQFCSIMHQRYSAPYHFRHFAFPTIESAKNVNLLGEKKQPEYLKPDHPENDHQSPFDCVQTQCSKHDPFFLCHEGTSPRFSPKFLKKSTDNPFTIYF